MSNLPALPDDTLLQRFLDQSIKYEETGAPIPRPLLLYAAAGGGAMLLAAGLVQIWPSPEAIAHSGFFLIGKAALASFVAAIRALAVPFLIAGLLSLAATAYLALRPRQRLFWHYACVAELVGGVGTLGVNALVLVAILLTVVIWILIVSLALAVIGLFLAGLDG